MIAKYIIVNDGGFELPVIFDSLINHSTAAIGMKVVSAGKLDWDGNDLIVSHGSFTLKIPQDSDRRKFDYQILEKFIKESY